jgi:DNA-binding phage protein
MNKWAAIREFVIGRVMDRSTNLTALARDSGVNYWWLRRIRSRREDVKDPGFEKIGRVFEALGGRAPKLPALPLGEANARSESSAGLHDQ